MVSKAQKKAVASYRARQKRKGLVRIEVAVPAEDAPRVRALAKRLTDDPERTRDAIDELVGSASETSAKRMLASMPEDLPLERRRDLPRDVEL